MVKTVLIIVTAFASGFLFHAFFFPKLQVEDIPKDISRGQLLNSAKFKLGPETTNDGFITKVVYKDNEFQPNHVDIIRGNYITITNTEKDNQMWLQSNNSLLTTPRGYAESEQVKTTLVEPGTYTVTNKLNPEAKLIVKVK